MPMKVRAESERERERELKKHGDQVYYVLGTDFRATFYHTILVNRMLVNHLEYLHKIIK